MKYVSVKDICDIKTGKYDANHAKENGKYKFFTCALCPIQADTYSFKGKLVMLPGNGANLGEVMYYEGKIEAYQRTYVLHNIKINAKFLFYYLKLNWKRYILRRQIGSATNYMKLDDILNFEIPNIDLDTQCKIVEILDKAQNLIDKRKEQIRTLDELIKSQFIEMFGEPIKNTKGWNKVKLSALGEWKTGGTPSRNNSDYFKGNIPWLSSGELNNKYCFGSNEHITEEAIKNSSAKLIEKESLLLGMYDTAALKSTINMVECTCNQAIAYSKLNNAIANSVYVYYCIQMGKDFYKSQQRGVRQKNLNLTMIKDLEIIMPPLELQNNFIDFIKQIDKLKFKMEKSLKSLEDNFNSLMQRAFKGELFN